MMDKSDVCVFNNPFPLTCIDFSLTLRMFQYVFSPILALIWFCSFNMHASSLHHLMPDA